MNEGLKKNEWILLSLREREREGSIQNWSETSINATSNQLKLNHYEYQ